ncbi:MAG: M48 family metalloprotease, partial [Rhodothermales bacterium]
VFHVKHLCRLATLLVITVFISSCSLSRSPISGKKRAYAYSWQQEVQIGKEADQQIQAAYGVYEDEEVLRYVREVGESVLATSHMRGSETLAMFRETEFFFRVLDSPVVNAFALPGGYIYVTRGLLYHMNNEAQLAVVLGHEIGHVAARHASQRTLEQQLGQLVLFGGAIAGQELLNLPAQDILNLGGTAAQLMFLQYSRDDERESDNLGVEYAARAGYEASEGAHFFQTLKRIGESSGQQIPGWMSSHPDPGEREETIRQLASEWQTRVEMTRIEQDDLYDRLDGIVLGDNPRQGFVENGVFYHPDLRFQFPVPSGFSVINQPTQVVLVENEERAVQIFSFSDAATPRAAVEEFLRQEGIQRVDAGPASSNGLVAHYAVADAQTEQGQTVRLFVYYVSYDEQVYGFIGYTLQDAFATYESAFRSTAAGFAQLTDSRILNIDPARIAVGPAGRAAPFQVFVSSELPFELTPEDLAIINQVELRQPIEAGRLLKLAQ